MTISGVPGLAVPGLADLSMVEWLEFIGTADGEITLSASSAGLIELSATTAADIALSGQSAAEATLTGEVQS